MPWKRGKPGVSPLATRQSAEEGVLGLLQAGEHILHDVAVQRTVFRQRGTERL